MLSLRPLSAAFPASPASAWVRAPRGPRLGRYWRGTWSWGHQDVSLMNRRLGRHHGGHRPTHLPRRPSSAQDETTHDSSGDAAGGSGHVLLSVGIRPRSQSTSGLNLLSFLNRAMSIKMSRTNLLR